jgi:hypothetical protein
MPRVISVFLPTLSTDRVRRKAGDTAPPLETPLVLAGRDGRRRVVLAADAAAHAAGLCVGMPANKAQALVQGLVIQDANPIANAHAATIVAAKAERPFLSVDDLWRRAGVPSASLVQLAEADAFQPAMGLVRREALWAIKALRDEPLPLFAAAAAREDKPAAEIEEPMIALRPMTAGSEVVEDYGHVGLTLRQHPVTFLRGDLTAPHGHLHPGHGRARRALA